MKNILISIIFIHMLTPNLYAAELKDCSVYNKLNPKYLACKTANFAKGTAIIKKNHGLKKKKKLTSLKKK